MSKDILAYNNSQSDSDKAICNILSEALNKSFPEQESKVWHGHPVWFLNGNPIVGCSRQKAGVRLMFWSGADFSEPDLKIGTGKFKDASIFYNDLSQINKTNLERWFEKAKLIQWDYKNIVKKRGVLERLK